MKSSPLHHRIHKHVVGHVRRVHKHISHHTTRLLSSIRHAQLYRWYRAHLPAFTLTDTLVATGIFLILTSTVLVAINPLKMFVDSRNNKRIRELKVVRDSLVQYTTDNTTGATNILGVSIPPCTESPGTEIGTGAGKVDLSNLSGFIPTYLASIPVDPKIGTAASTGYRVCRKSDLDYCVTAMYPESAGGSTVTMGCDYSIITPSPTPPGVPTSTPTPTVAPVTSGLVLSHQMSAGTGTTSLDETTNANNGTLTNGPTWTTGYLGSGISFDGTNDYISVPHSSTLALTGDMTITAWVKPTDRQYDGIVGKTSGNTAAPYDFYLTGTTGIPRFLRGNGSASASVDASAAPATGQWSHVAVVMSGTTVTHYLNGVANGSGTLSTTIGDAGGALRIGSRADDVTMFKGVMDDVRIYNRALSADEISRIKAPAPTPTATPTPTNTPTNTPTPTPTMSYWTTGATGGTARYGHTANVYGDKMYVWGGSNAGYLNTMDIYNITTNTWTTGAAGGTARKYHSSVVNADKIYYWGGTNGSNLNTMDIYDITNNTWSTGAAGGTARSGHGSVIYGGKMYSFLGTNGSPLYSLDIYDIAGNSWSTGASDFTQSRYYFPAFLYNDKMYSWAGGNGGSNTMRIYNITSNTHSAGTTGGTARYYVGAVMYNGKMYSWSGFGGSNIVDIFDPSNNTWTTGTPGGSSRYAHSSVLYGNKIIHWGGINGPYLDTMDIYNISEPAPTSTPTPSLTPTNTPTATPTPTLTNTPIPTPTSGGKGQSGA